MVATGVAFGIAAYVRMYILGSSRPDTPTVTGETATVTSVDADALKLSLALTVTNPNSRELPVDSVAVEVVLTGDPPAGGFRSGVLKLPQTVVLAPHTATRIVVPVDVQWKGSPRFLGLTLAQGPVPFTADGNVELDVTVPRRWQAFVPFHVAGAITREQVQASQQKVLRLLLP
jgi:hypothetical protein